VYAALERIVGEVLDAASETPGSCGVGCGGPMESFGRTVSPLNIPGWRQFPLRDRLARSTGLAVTVQNDAKALALGEGWKGAAAASRNFLAMVVSTGVGGGIVLDGALLEGSAGNAGHIGHVVVEPDGSPCPCGGRGCLEAEASGPSIARTTGRPPAEASEQVRRRTGTLVGRAVASVANLLFEAAQAEIDDRCRLAFSVGTRIVPAGLGELGPLVGAAAVARTAHATAHASAHDDAAAHADDHAPDPVVA
jgi:glucokinase